MYAPTFMRTFTPQLWGKKLVPEKKNFKFSPQLSLGMNARLISGLMLLSCSRYKSSSRYRAFSSLAHSSFFYPTWVEYFDSLKYEGRSVNVNEVT